MQSKVYPPVGTKVAVTFKINSEGQVTHIVKVDSTSTGPGTEAVVSAIASRAPYGKWTEEMKARLGTAQQITFTFYYQ